MVFVIFLYWATSPFVDTMNNNFLMACDHLRLPVDLNLEHTAYTLWTSTPSLIVIQGKLQFHKHGPIQTLQHSVQQIHSQTDVVLYKWVFTV